MESVFQQNDNRTELSDVGEFALIEKLTAELQVINKSTIKAVGDDAAVIQNGDMQTLVSVDLLVEGVHFDLMYTPLKHLGYKAAVVNFSDIAAMNGKPMQIVIGLAVSNRFSLEALEELYSGIRLACEQYGVDLVGGDTTSSMSGLFISVTVIGQALPQDICYRHGAAENDLLCVSGDLGAAYMGLMLLEREKAVYKADPSMQPDLDGNDYVLSRQLKPEARFDVLEELKKVGVKPSSMIDISDGLASEIIHLCKASNLGCRIYETKIPIDPATIRLAEEFRLVPSIPALNGGEDYELLFTISPSDFEKIRNIESVSVIGHMTTNRGETVMITIDDRLIPLKAQGWDGLRNNNKQD